MNMDRRARHIELNTLTCVVMGLTGMRTTVELQNDAYVTGRIIDVDAKLNIEMGMVKYVDINGKSFSLDTFHVMGKKVRCVHIPDKVDVIKMIQERVNPTTKKMGLSKKGHIVQKRSAQTLRRFHRQKEAEASKSTTS